MTDMLVPETPAVKVVNAFVTPNPTKECKLRYYASQRVLKNRRKLRKLAKKAELVCGKDFCPWCVSCLVCEPPCSECKEIS